MAGAGIPASCSPKSMASGATSCPAASQSRSLHCRARRQWARMAATFERGGSMRQTIVLTTGMIIAAGVMAFGLLVMARELRDVSGQVAALSRNANSIAGDVTSIADNVSAIADAL